MRDLEALNIGVISMGILQHRQIGDRLRNDYVHSIDVSDVPRNRAEMVGLSRAVSSLSLVYLADADPQTAINSIVDGGGDNGIDLIHYDTTEKTLYLVQSKWNNSHNGGVDIGSVLKFLQGVKNLLNSKYEKFNSKVNQRRFEIDLALSNATKVVAVISYTGAGSFSNENRASIDEFITDVDETKELVSTRVLDQQILHTFISSGVQGATISENVQLFDWGWVDERVKAYYGKIAASDLVSLYKKYGPKLFSKNIRMFLGSESSANRGVLQTLTEAPENFWYFNNGITALAATISRKTIGGNSREAGQFDCTNLSIVNGAQTVGSLASIQSDQIEKLKNAVVPIRIIQTEGASDDLSASITRNNNTQNKIDPRNFVALDPEQERLRNEFLVDGIDYEYRQGEIEHSANSRLGLVEATLALATTDDQVELCVQAKREIGRLWEDINRAPYRHLFNPGQNSENVWNRVQAFRRLDSAILKLQSSSTNKEKSIAVHGNRLLLHSCYKALVASGGSPNLSNKTDAEIGSKVSELFSRMEAIIADHFPDNYLASLFKNQAKCRTIASELV